MEKNWRRNEKKRQGMSFRVDGGTSPPSFGQGGRRSIHCPDSFCDKCQFHNFVVTLLPWSK